MDCRRYEKLLALDAGGDLAPRRARALAAHLRDCPACRAAARDFSATRELLAADEPPEFDAAFFESVRRGVMKEIDAAGAAPPSGLAALFRPLFARPALASAVAFALVAAFALLGLLLRGGREPVNDAPRHVAADEARPSGDDPQPTRDETVREDASVREPGPAPSPNVRGPRRAAPKRTQFARSVRLAAPRDRNLPAPLIPIDNPAPSAVAQAGVDDERRMLRIELQTSDPNVRIIWLTPQTSATNDRE